MDIFNEQEWEMLIRDPLWYKEIVPKYALSRKLIADIPSQKEEIKKKAYDFFEKHLAQNTIALGTTGKDFDAERKSIDTIVIHHTKNPPGMTRDRLFLLRLYASYYMAPYSDEDKKIKGTPIYSGHFRKGKQVFWPYHWVIRSDGRAERLLKDNEIGWHAGNWDINCRSVAIVFDGNYEESSPSTAELRSAANVIKTHYPYVKNERVFGHREINTKTRCPSDLFLTSPEMTGWKDLLISMSRKS